MDDLGQTISLCPVCCRRITAYRQQEQETVFLVKECPEHGRFRTPIWRGEPSFAGWQRSKIPSTLQHPLTTVEHGCPFDCGLCPAHGQHTCTALLEVTSRCNLACPVCFADAGADPAPDLSLAQIEAMFETVLAASGVCNIQLSGGEPTVRDDLADIIRLGRRKGFTFIQLNTNGLRLAADPTYAASLKEAGLSSVFLQFDGVSSHAHQSLRGRDLCGIKERAINHCAVAGLGVVLVATLVPGVNTEEIYDIISYGVSQAPTVRGVHFQPISYFGRYPHAGPADSKRITLPEVIQCITRQSGGMIDARYFAPPGCEHALCSFHGMFLVEESGRLTSISSGSSCCDGNRSGFLPTARAGREQSVRTTARQWSLPMAAVTAKQGAAADATAQDDFDRFLARARTHTFSISAMAFQDVWNLDLERLRGCCIHVATPDNRLIPFCAYNLTSASGRSLYPRKVETCG